MKNNVIISFLSARAKFLGSMGLISIYAIEKVAIESSLMGINLAFELVDLATDLDMSEVQFLDKVDNLKKELSLNYGISKLGLCQDHIEKIASMVMGNVQADLSYKDINSITNILKLSL